MSYLITQPDGTLVLQVLDGTADGPKVNPGLNASDINLIGHNYPNYGQLQNENFISLLQNFANDTPPSKPLPGELWYDTSTGFLKVYNGTNFIAVSPLIISATTPDTRFVGVEWWDTTNEQLKVFNGTNWKVIGPAYSIVDGISGAIVEHVIDTNNASHTVVKVYTNGNLISIASADATFTPLVSIPGFPVINPGVTLNANGNTLMYGTSVNAQQLGGITAANYARTDISSTFGANIAIGGGKLAINASPDGHIGLVNSTIRGNVAIYNNVNGLSTRTLHISGVDGSVVVANDPTVPMGVATKNYVDSSIVIATTPLATSVSPGFSGNATYNVSLLPSDNTNLLATTAWTQSAISASLTGPWFGSAKFVSTDTPGPADGNIGDFWFQI